MIKDIARTLCARLSPHTTLGTVLILIIKERMEGICPFLENRTLRCRKSRAIISLFIDVFVTGADRLGAQLTISMT